VEATTEKNIDFTKTDTFVLYCCYFCHLWWWIKFCVASPSEQWKHELNAINHDVFNKFQTLTNVLWTTAAAVLWPPVTMYLIVTTVPVRQVILVMDLPAQVMTAV